MWQIFSVSSVRALIGLCLGLSVWAAPQKTILVYGDSLSAGYGISLAESWPSLLQNKLGTSARVVNASLTGETTAGGLSRLPAALKQHKPQLVILALGANDGLRGLPVSLAQSNLQRMIDLSQASGARVLLLAMRMPPNFGMAYTQKFDQMYQELSQKNRLPKPPFLLEGIADQPQMFQNDQLHPTAQAQARLLANVWPSFKGMLR